MRQEGEQFLDLRNLYKIEKELMLEGDFSVKRTTEINFDVIRRCKPKMHIFGYRFPLLMERMTKIIYREILDMIWEVVVEGDEFVLPIGMASFILIEGYTKNSYYKSKFYRERAVFLEMRICSSTNPKYNDYRGKLYAAGIKEVNKRMRDGLYYSKDSQMTYKSVKNGLYRS